MERFWKRYGRYIGAGVTVTAALVSAAGSYQYYTGYVEEVVYERLWSSVLYSVIQLFLFSPTVDTGEATPVLYEVGKWLAPLCTAYWLFRAAESVFRHNVAAIKRRFSSGKQIVVFGYHESSELFIRKLKKEDRQLQVVLVAQGDLEREKRLNLERSGFLVYQMDILDQELLWREDIIRKLCLHKAEEIVLFYEDPTWNFTLLKFLADWAKKQEDAFQYKKGRERSCSIWCEDATMKKIIADYYDSLEGIRPWNLNLFDMPELTAMELFKKEPLYANCFQWALENCENREKFLEVVPQPHILIAGFGRYGQAVLKYAVLTGTLSFCSRVKRHEKLRVTIIDSQAQRCRETVEAAYPRIDRICRISYIDSDIGSGRIEKALFDLPRITYTAICFSEQSLCVKAMEKIRTYLSMAEIYERGREDMELQVPVAVRMKTDGAVIRYWNEQQGQSAGVCRVFPFGDNHEILTRENVIGYRLEAQAKAFHENYKEIQTCITGIRPEDEKKKDREALWNELDFESKESCRGQVLNKPYFQKLIKVMGALPDREAILPLEKTEFLKMLSACPSLDMLAAMEHERWCVFCYATGYGGFHEDPGEKRKIHMVKAGDKTYYGKVHNCLIDSWDQMKADERVNATVVYDVCGIYSYSQEDKI
ncbi:MAG: hypothetical protein HFG73_07740 [Hungatella sp.]|nr:hypothetical protein [Hungatella sp.]